MNGWIKLYRQFRKSSIYTNSNAVHCWVECLLRASHEEKEFYSKRTKITLKSGQFLMGREEFARNIGISSSTAWYWILQFESDSMIDTKRTALGTIVTINKWKEYQGVDSKVDRRWTGDEQEMNTNKNNKNIKNNKNNIYIPVKKKYSSLKSLGEPELVEVSQKYGVPLPFVQNSLDSLINYCQSKGRVYKDYKAALRNFVKNDIIKYRKEVGYRDRTRAIDATEV